LAVLLASCGGGGGNGGGNGGGLPNPGANVTLSGIVTFDLVPAVVGVGLDYPQTKASPARGVSVELVSGATVLATTITDAAGAYSFSVAQNTSVLIRARAEMVRAGSPGWDFRVVDNTSSNALYVLEGAAASTGTADSTRDLHAPSGWGGSSYTATRAAAPFAILDVVYDATQFVLAADPVASFPALLVHWSPNNKPTFGANGGPDPTTGEIGTSFFRSGFGIFLLGAEDADTEEYDRHVIVHEWGHYFEDAFSRSDSIGGPHTRGDQLDMRVAFGEGWGNALSAMVTGDSVYRDVSGPQQGDGFGFNVEGPPPFANQNPNPGWYSEESIQELLYDLYDSNADFMADGLTIDDVALGFAPIYAVLRDQQRAAIALTSIFPFINALKAVVPADASLIDALVNAQSIDTIGDDYGATETNHGDPPSPDLQSVYGTLTVGGGPVNVCSLDDFNSPPPGTGSTNKLGSRRFLRFSAASSANHTFRAVATAVPPGESADPDMELHRAGFVASLIGAPGADCTAATPLLCNETGTLSLTPGDYVLEVYEWTNTNADDDPEFPPIGRTCFDVEVTQP
jgi:hypothetical protein